MSEDLLQSTIRDLEEAVRSFSPGKAQQNARDRYVIDHFLRGLGITFDPAEIALPDDDPPDGRFRGAAFEVKEIQEIGRRRNDEYKQQLDKARKAHAFEELLKPFSPENIPLKEVYERIMLETQALTVGKYCAPAVRRSLDLLFYVNLGMKTAWGIEDGARPSIKPLMSQGWRSVSFLHGLATTCVIVASKSAPDFLRAVEGRLAHADDVGDE